MKREPTTLQIGGSTYIIGDWDVDKSLETMVWLVKTFGEGFMSLFMSKEGLDNAEKLMTGEIEEEDEKHMLEFARKILMNLDPKEYAKYSRIIVDGARCDGEAIDFKFHFIGKIGELHKLMFNILRHQYSDFLPGGGGEG
ncbi:MAG: hypothetical protein E2O82_03715 [Betaproteobacteria bacterium]|nr:MAG: hypothetical protein E2O82_03715 [Betaproteobacteria bacterium]